MLGGALTSITVTRGARSAHDHLLAHLAFDWKPMGLIGAPSDDDLARLVAFAEGKALSAWANA